MYYAVIEIDTVLFEFLLSASGRDKTQSVRYIRKVKFRF